MNSLSYSTKNLIPTLKPSEKLWLDIGIMYLNLQKFIELDDKVKEFKEDLFKTDGFIIIKIRTK